MLDIQNYAVTGFDESGTVVDEMDGMDMELTQRKAQYLNDMREHTLRMG